MVNWMPEKILSANERQAIRRRYCREHTLARLNDWAVQDDKNPTALLYLSEHKKVKSVVDSCEGVLMQAVENAERFDKDFNKLADGTVDNILGAAIQASELGNLTIDTTGHPLFKPWSPGESNMKRKNDLELTVGDLSSGDKA
jgi:hypothetical protein